jgi:hypothetical protein
MKKICSVVVLVLASACGNQNHSNEPSDIRQADLSGVTSGLVLTVKNSLPEQQVGANRVRPNLNAFFCSPMPTSNGPTPRTEDRCIRLSGVIRNGTEQAFVISRQDLAQVYSRGQGKAAFEFADDQQLTSIPWHCYTPNNQVTLDPNFDTKQSWHVEVNQRFALSYGCLVDRR